MKPHVSEKSGHQLTLTGRVSQLLFKSNFLWFCLAWLLIILSWELGSWLEWLNPQILPPPSETIPYAFSGNITIGFGQQKTGLFESTTITLGRVGAGMLIGLLVSSCLAIMVIELPILRRLILPLVQSLAPIAPVAWIPFTIVVIGIGGPAAVFIVFMAVLGTMTLSLIAALDSIPDEYLKIAHNLGTSRIRMWWYIRLPAIIPSTMTAIRMSFFGAWMAVLAGEMAGLNSGLGYMIIMAQQMYNMKLVMVGILAIGFIGFAIDRLLLLINARLLQWVQ
ncbi:MULTISPECIES: ABC transporter permease [Nitrosomonas]|uniref:NitT/TauT family transport system permease protein/taurine transport system permease protein n=2 Tax=Nitrosomonas eutropha TaxID=916 RepID=A0ABX5M9P4_9PROT|nr:MULTISPECIES: ABC transporter permease [Nitrosomonas]ABI60275.1 binding-protein-dependent transport systems inner membrane component [Nitrosomonas eutropha C91]MXS80630.1 ABC transporter permease [Nitrosomonas sp. GH22]PXV81684.1 NitT/TauT family transport system permease protein/taurine transport system permease protein [Nitrosomonas eutropha]SDW73760.1 NitT/TauT family transport system permease protein/taurine transport system permease protein [Nitrosomonas eutropha]SEI72645.1 NitT/TauT f